MTDQKSADWLPAGSRGVEVEVRNNGRRDEFNQNSKLTEMMMDGQINGGSLTFPAQASDLSGVTDTGSLNPAEAKSPEHPEQHGDSTKSKRVSVPAGQCLRKHESKKTKLGMGKSKIKKELTLPRRASKRIAASRVDAVQQLKTSTRARQAAIKQSREGVRSTTVGSSSGSSVSFGFEQPDYFEVKPEKQIENEEAVINGDYKQRHSEEHVGKLEIHDEAEEKPGLQPDFPFGDFLTDPCIAFAIQTLTGTAFDDSPKVHFENTEIDNMSSKKQKTSVDLPPGNIFKPEEHLGKVGTGDKAEQKSESEAELSFGGSWADPCIEFAIKTLTGEIPLDYDSRIEDCFQQQLSSSRSQGTSDLTLQNVGLDNFSQTDVSCQQFCEEEIPVFKKQAYIAPAHTASASSQSSAGLDITHKGRDRQQQSM